MRNFSFFFVHYDSVYLEEQKRNEANRKEMVGRVAKSHKKCKYLFFYKKNALNHVMGYAITSRHNLYTHQRQASLISLSFAACICGVVVRRRLLPYCVITSSRYMCKIGEHRDHRSGAILWAWVWVSLNQSLYVCIIYTIIILFLLYSNEFTYGAKSQFRFIPDTTLAR